MSKRSVPKVSGLVKVGTLVAAPEDDVASLPDFEPTLAAFVEADAGAPGIVAEVVDVPELPSVVAPKAHISSSKTSPAALSVSEDELDSDRWLLIPLAKLKIHPFNSRTVRTQERIEEVSRMLEDEHIQREPITVVPGRKPEDRGFYYILSGQTRYHAANLAGWKALKSQVNEQIDPDNHLAFWKASLEHNTSVKETDWDVALRAKQLIEEKHSLESVQIASRRDARALRRLLAMMELPEPVLAVVREHPAKLSSHFCEPLRAGIEDLGEEAIAAIAKKCVEEGFSHKALVDHIEREIRKKDRRMGGTSRRATREFMQPIVIGSNKQEAGKFKINQSVKAAGNRSVTLSADIPEALVEAFKADILAAIEKLAK